MSENPKNRLFLIFRILLSVSLVLLSALFAIHLYVLNVLSQDVMMIAAGIIIAIDAVFIILLNFAARKKASQIACSVLAVAVAVCFGLGSFYINKTNLTLSSLTSKDGKVKNIISVYTLKDSDIDNEEELNNQKIGILSQINKAGTERLLDSLNDKSIQVKTEEFNNFGPLVQALYDKDVEAIVLNDVYINNITELEKFQDFTSRTKVVYTYTYYTDVITSSNSVTNITKEPFTVMMNGSDSRGELGDTDRSDVNMIVTINPATNVVLLVSIPRDAYVETVCDPEYDCLNGQYDKLTHTGIHTYNTTKKTIESLLGVDINYVFRANFAAVVDIVDALGGIDVNVAEGYAVDHFYTNDMFGTEYGVTEGINHLNGQAALCYARERYAYLEGDFQRIRNQQEVLTQIAKKASSAEGIARYTSLLDAIDGNFWTDLSTNEITEFIQYQISEGPEWAFISYSLSGTTDSLYCAESYNNASVVVLDQNTVRFARELINAVLDGKTREEITAMIEENVPGAADYDYLNDVNTSQYEQEYVDESYQVVEEPVYYETYTPPVYESVPDYSINNNTNSYPSYDSEYQEPAIEQPDTSVEEYVPEQTLPEVTPPEAVEPETGGDEIYVPEEQNQKSEEVISSDSTSAS